MKYTRPGMIVSLMAAAGVAVAFPGFVKDLETTYKLKADSNIKKQSCTVCHVGKTPKLNPYGADLKKIMAELKTKKITAEIFKKADDQDSDKDGVKNGEELKADTLPGDEKSKPGA